MIFFVFSEEKKLAFFLFLVGNGNGNSALIGCTGYLNLSLQHLAECVPAVPGKHLHQQRTAVRQYLQ